MLCARLPQTVASPVVELGLQGALTQSLRLLSLVAPRHVGFSRTRDRAYVCGGGRVFDRLATRKPLATAQTLVPRMEEYKTDN